MRLSISSLLYAGAFITPAFASPYGQTVLGGLIHNYGEQVYKGADQYLDEAQRVILRGKSNLEKWYHQGTEFIKQNGLLYEYVSHPVFPDYHLRVTEPKLCDPKVKQASGYFDISDDKHLFYWFFESRNAPEDSPLILWLNGGPGCSSSTGLLFELGPCSVNDHGNGTTPNKYSWNEHANIIFLDQPINVGWSYGDDGKTVSTSPVAAEDVYAFLQLFFKRFPKYNKQFHIAAESYGGRYGPTIANEIYRQNKALSPDAHVHDNVKKINLASVILANGLTNPYLQFGEIANWACDGPYPIIEGAQCEALRAKTPTCQRLIKSCYEFNSRFTCVPASLYCNGQLFGPLMQLGLNPYDVRRKCDKETDGPLCYKQMEWIDVFMNDPAVKTALGVDPSRQFESCNMDVNRDFTLQGDGVRDSSILLPELINDGVRLLVYAGNADMMCNYLGNKAWVSALETNFLDEFTESKPTPWVTVESGRIAGEVRSAGGHGFTAGNVTFVTVFEAGHMVPYDQPEAASDLINRWLLDVPLTFNAKAEAEALPSGGWA